MYEVINEELGIMACDLEDLTTAQVVNFLGSWEDNAKIGTLTMFLDDSYNLVLNRNHKNYVMRNRDQHLEKSMKKGSQKRFIL